MDADADPALESWGIECRLRAGAVPAAFAIALVFHAWPTGHFLQRTFLTMIPHELGHAFTAWWCGFGAMPTLWKTMIPEARGVVTPVIVGAGNAALVVLGWTRNHTGWIVLGVALGLLQFIGTSAVSTERAQAVITFGGDGGAMVIGSVLVLLFFVQPGTRLHSTGLRWGFLAIGAATLVDTSATWISARSNPDVIPFGEIEGVGLSDPSKLDEIYGWTTKQMVGRYVTLATVCFLVIGVVWAWAIWDARRRATAT